MNIQKRRRRATKKIRRLMWPQLIRRWFKLVEKSWGGPEGFKHTTVVVVVVNESGEGIYE